MLQIGDVHIPSHALLAPIAGYTDRAFRLMVRAAGHDGLAYTELIHPRGIENQCKQALDIEADDPRDHPLAIQLYGNDVEWFRKAAHWAEQKGAKVIDINMGCPIDKVTKTNGGSMLLCDPDRTTRMAEAIVKSVRVPVTAKLRLGWDWDHITAPQLARQLESVGIALITIHGRTTGMRFKGRVNLDGIAEVVSAVTSIPVIGNGDITTVDDAVRMIDYTKCDGVMVARGSIKHPWLLRDIGHYLTHGERPAEHTVAEKCRLIRLHFDGMRQYRRESEAITVMRGRIAGYSKSMGHIKPIKERIRLMKCVDEFYEAMDELESRLDPHWTRVPKHVFLTGDQRDYLAQAAADQITSRM